MIAIMVLLLPLASAISSPSSSALPELDVNGLEVVLTLEDDIWTQEAWMDLETRGLVPLRVLSENSVLVWSEEGILPSSEFELRIADKAEWRGDGAGLGMQGGLVKIVLEPRLPVSAHQQIAASFDSFGLDVVLPSSYSAAPFDFITALPADVSIADFLSIQGV